MHRLSFVFVIMLAGFAARLYAADEKPLEGDLKELQGEWRMVSAESEGMSLPDELVKAIRMTFKGDEMSMRMSGDGQDDHKATIKLDAAKTPKTIELVPADGPESGKTIMGIYELDGGKLKICAASKSGDETTRPKELKSAGETKTILFVLERVKEK